MVSESAVKLSRRERLRQETIAEIKDVAREQIAERGAAALSLGGVADKLGMTTPALYRYFANRDALVTALIVDAYGSLAAALEASGAESPEMDFGGRFQQMLVAYRRWAVAYPQQYNLMYGSPIAGYEAPRERVLPAAARSLRLFVQLLHDADRAGVLRIPAPYQEPPVSLAPVLDDMRLSLPDLDVQPAVLTLALMIWVRFQGFVWQELHGHLTAPILQTGELYHMEVVALSQRLGLTVG